MTKYAYIIGNSRIETTDITSIPKGLQYETIEFSNDPVVVIPSEISRAEFYWGLHLQNVEEQDVLNFIDSQIPEGITKSKAKILFTQASIFEHYNEMLNNFIAGFNQYLQAIGKVPIVFDDIFINGITLNN